MSPTPLVQFFRKIADIRLTASVHFDAFRAEPHAYITATKWLIKRKRVRAQGHFARLLALSPRSYMLWASREDRDGREPSQLCPDKPIVVLIKRELNDSAADIATTMASVRQESLVAVPVGSAAPSTLANIAGAIDWTTNPWLLVVRCGDKISPGAAAAYRSMMNDHSTHLIYADDDVVDGNRRKSPYFKPDWNEELFRHWDYLTGSCILRTTRAELEAMSARRDWDRALVANAAGRGKPLHLRQMLHHRKKRPVQHLPVQPLAIAADLPPVSIIVPTRNRVDLLRTCLEGVAAAAYRKVEVIVMDNDSDDPETLAYLAALDPARHRVIRHSGPFNYSTINNRGVDLAMGHLICLLNNDIEMTDTHWLATLATQALRPNVGAVGARLLYPDGRIQHAGVVIGVGNAAGHAHRFLRPHEEGYFHRHSLPQFTMAVTAACLVVERDKFRAVGGLNEKDFPVAFNDVDLCLRLNERGWQSLYEPRATLIHHESVSRGWDKDPVGAARFASELAALKRIWKTDEVYDPYHHPQLSRASERFAVVL